MIQRPLMTPDELKSMPKFSFVVMKTGAYPMRTKLELFFKWGIAFEKPYVLTEQSERKVAYADRKEIEAAIKKKYPPENDLLPVEDSGRAANKQSPAQKVPPELAQQQTTEQKPNAGENEKTVPTPTIVKKNWKDRVKNNYL